MPSYSPTYTADPTDADLAAMLTAAGLYNSTIAVWNQGMVAGAVRRFEKATGRIPFLAQASNTFTYDPPGGSSKQMQNPFVGGGKKIELDPYFTSISAIAWGVSYDNPNGVPVDINRQVYFKPDNHAALGLPIEWLEFLFPVYGLQQSITVTGTPGSFTAWPEDAWNAVMAQAAANISAVLGASISGGTTGFRDDSQSETYAANPLAAFEEGWRAMFMQGVKAYKSLRVGLNS